MEWQAARVADRSYPVVCIPQPCPSRPMGRLWSAAFPLSASWPTRRPSRRDHCGGSDPPRRGGVSGGPKGGPLTPPRCRTSGQKGGVAPSTSTPLVRRTGRGGNTQGAAPLRIVARDTGNPRQPLSNGAFQAKPRPQRRGVRPQRGERCGCQKMRHLRAPPGLFQWRIDTTPPP